MRPEPAAAVLAWLKRSSDDGLHTIAVTIAEIRYGIARIPEGQRRQSLHQAATRYSRPSLARSCPSTSPPPAPTPTSSRAGKQGNPISGFDAQIAAICRSQTASGHPDHQRLRRYRHQPS
ncbi:VapC toxin family PIN domain ribonuclease [Actinoplanes palleronii]